MVEEVYHFDGLPCELFVLLLGVGRAEALLSDGENTREPRALMKLDEDTDETSERTLALDTREEGGKKRGGGSTIRSEGWIASVRWRVGRQSGQGKLGLSVSSRSWWALQ